jgi:hypothetical protein
MERVESRIVPSVCSVQQRKNRACIYERISGRSERLRRLRTTSRAVSARRELRLASTPRQRAAALRSFRFARSSGASVSHFFSQSRTAVSRTEDTDTLRRCASRSRSDLSSSDKRQLYTSVFMHYTCSAELHHTAIQFLNADFGPTRCRGRFPRLQYWEAIGTYLELGQAKITVNY